MTRLAPCRFGLVYPVLNDGKFRPNVSIFCFFLVLNGYADFGRFGRGFFRIKDENFSDVDTTLLKIKFDLISCRTQTKPRDRQIPIVTHNWRNPFKRAAFFLSNKCNILFVFSRVVKPVALFKQLLGFGREGGFFVSRRS